MVLDQASQAGLGPRSLVDRRTLDLGVSASTCARVDPILVYLRQCASGVAQIDRVCGAGVRNPDMYEKAKHHGNSIHTRLHEQQVNSTSSAKVQPEATARAAD